VIYESNREIYDLERQTIALEKKLKKIVILNQQDGFVLVSKLAEIPYKLSRMSGKFQKQAILKVLTFWLQIFTGVMLKDTKMPTVYVNPNC